MHFDYDVQSPTTPFLTRINLPGYRQTSPGIRMASNDIALLSDLSVSTSLASDHLSTLVTINSEQSTIDGPERTYINIKKADWARHAETCDKYLAEAVYTRTVEHAGKTCRKVVNMASGLFIPAGRIQHFKPILPAPAKSLADERDRNCGLNPADETLNDQNKQTQNMVVKDKRTKWRSAFKKWTIEGTYRIYGGLLWA